MIFSFVATATVPVYLDVDADSFEAAFEIAMNSEYGQWEVVPEEIIEINGMKELEAPPKG